LTLEELREATQSAAALRARTRLDPAGGAGDKIFPATYEGGRLAAERRRIDGVERNCVLLDSVQSQANRFETALQDAHDRGRLSVPMLRVRFPDDLAREFGPITSLTAPHRCYDAILRDSTLAGTPFPETEPGRALHGARADDATALLRWCPTALVFGAWDSTGVRGGMGAKFPRAVSSEIVGVDAERGVRTSSRIDPLGIRAQVAIVVGEDGEWRLAEAAEKRTKRPSEVNHGNVAPSIAEPGGVTVDHAEQTWVLSLPALRRYRFPVHRLLSDQKDHAALTVLAALAVAGRALARDDGLFLRSRCHLVPLSGASTLEVVDRDGSVRTVADPDADGALSTLAEAVEAARAEGLPWEDAPVELEPQDKLVQLVRRSLALAPGAAEE